MNDFKKKIIEFAPPLFTSLNTLVLNREQISILSGWVYLMTMLLNYHSNRENPVVTKQKIAYLKEYLQHTDSLTTFICSLDGKRWSTSYRVHRRWYDETISIPEFVSTFGICRPFNTQVTSFGLGKLFVEAFSSPYYRLLEDFRISAKSKGLFQIWPKPSPFNPFAKRSAKLPTKLVLDDDEADIIADAFANRFDILYGAKSVRRYRV